MCEFEKYKFEADREVSQIFESENNSGTLNVRPVRIDDGSMVAPKYVSSVLCPREDRA